MLVEDEGSSLTLRDVVIRSSRTNSRGTGGRGIAVQNGGVLDAARVLLDDHREYGLYVQASSVTLADVIVRGTRERPYDVGRTAGILVHDGSTMDAQGLLVERNQRHGILVNGATVRMSDVVVRDTVQHSVGRDGRGVQAQEGATIEATRLVVERSMEAGVLGALGDTRLVLSDVLIRDSIPGARGGGRGIDVEDETALVAERVRIERSADIGIFAGQFDYTGPTDVTLRDVSISFATSVDAEPDGLGVGLQDDSVMVAERLVVRDHLSGGLALHDGARMTLTDVAIRGTDAESAPRGARGVLVQSASTLGAERLLIERSRYTGVFSNAAGSSTRLDDTVIRDTRARSVDLRGGDAIVAQVESSIEAERLVVVDARAGGVVVTSAAEATIRDASIANILRSECADDSCAEMSYGYGVGAISGSLRLSRFVVSGSETCGVFVAPAPFGIGSPDLDLVDGRVEGSVIGACVQAEGYDLSRLSATVAFVDNGSNLQTTDLPVPGELDLGARLQ